MGEARTSGVVVRLRMAGFGGLAGLALWILWEVIPGLALPGRAHLFVSVALVVAFVVPLTLAGPLPLRRLLLPAGMVSGGLAVVTVLASYRHDTADGLLSQGYPYAALLAVLVIGIPFVGARPAGHWRHYPTLFDLSWQSVTRLFASSIFLGLVWLLIFLADALFNVIGIGAIQRIWGIDLVNHTVSGAVFGLALAVSHELRAHVSPYLILRLLRLLLPLVLLVEAVFLLALPFKGMSGLVNGLSPAVTLASVAAISVVLITVTVERSDEEMPHSAWLVAALRGAAWLAPIFGALVLWALWIRISDYGWTPRRAVMVALSAVLMGYAGSYAAAVSRAGWATRIREANIVMALVSLAVAISWLTIFSPERLSARSQLARSLTGAEPPLYELAHDWGRAGQRALAELEAARPELSDNIAEARAAASRWEMTRALDEASRADREAAILSRLQVWPAPVALSLGVLGDYDLRRLERACAKDFPEGSGCLLINAPLGLDGLQLLVLSEGIGAEAISVATRDGALQFDGQVWSGRALSEAAFRALLRGEVQIAPATMSVLRVEGQEIFPLPSLR